MANAGMNRYIHGIIMKKVLLSIIALFAVVLSATADEDFITHRYDSFKACRLSGSSIVL